MSAIFGAININSICIEDQQNICDRFVNIYNSYDIDRMDNITFENGFMGCGIQYFNAESRYEKLPVNDVENKVIFTADCVLDNRDSILSELSIDDKSIPDGEIILQSYKKWGIECLKHLRGAYAFAIYDRSVGKVYLCNDHFANRCLFYTLRAGVLYFSTLLFPLVEASGLKYEVNDRWIVDSMSVRGPMMMTETRECAYKDIYKVDSGYFVEIDNNSKATYLRYWNPLLKNRVNNHITDDECGEKLRDILKNSVNACIRTDAQVGIQLSSGLDSSTIAGFAAPMIDKRGKKLYSYTSVPLKESGVENKNYYVVDETDGVKEICEMYPNIQPTFIECKGLSILNKAKDIVDMWELPCKSQQNAVWIDSLCKVSREDGCRIMLSGSTGNCTISNGRWEDYFIELLHKFRLVSFYNEFKYFSRTHRIQAKEYAKYIIKQQLEYRRDKLFHKYPDIYETIATRKDVGDRYNIADRFIGFTYMVPPTKNHKRMEREIYFPLAYAQMGEIDTKLSLTHGVLQRDPLNNVELIEFCLTLPIRCFVDSQYNRKLVRRHMKGIIPDSIREEYLNRGRQGADNSFRISLMWNEYEKDVKRLINEKNLYNYLNKEKVAEIIEQLDEDNIQEGIYDTGLIIDTYTLALFLSKIIV